MCLIVMVSDVYVTFLQMLTAVVCQCLHVLYGISCFIVMSYSFFCFFFFANHECCYLCVLAYFVCAFSVCLKGVCTKQCVKTLRDEGLLTECSK